MDQWAAGGTGGTQGGGDAVSRSEGGETTGRFIVVLSNEVQGDAGAMTQALQSVAGVSRVASSLDYESRALDVREAASADATVFPTLGVAVLPADRNRLASINTAVAQDPRVVAVEPERILYVRSEQAGASLEYARGYRDGVAHLYEQLTSGADGAALQSHARPGFVDNDDFTWGLQATKADTSSHDGQGVRVAVLDTGFDLEHPDFEGRPVTAQSFITGETAQDGHGHGTHCVGTSCGPANPSESRRYGVAGGAEIFVGKVLSDQGSGSDAGILAGIEWAMANGCQVISMSLGADVRQVSRAYEAVGRRALDAGSLIIAAAGNNAQRSGGNPGFVGIPANSPSIMAVAAIDNRLRIGDFSARSNPVRGGQIDVAGPGVAVFSSWPMPRRYNTINGTSMATPHVSGVAALFCQVTGKRGAALWSEVIRAALRLNLPSADVGAGLTQAPQ
ncbi:MAG TPA: S8 family serine peptidase [Acidimicrobiales bacterium]|nr:S8 family serine peptidase [Acidimicrobiales bacterium]